MPTQRLVLDTNVVMDLLHFADCHAAPLAEQLRSGRLLGFTDAACLAELERVTAYREFGLTAAARRELMRRYLELVSVCEADGEEHYPLPRCRDADDQKFLVLAARCRADLLITRDKRLLELSRRRRRPANSSAPAFSILTAEAAVRLLQAAPEDPARRV